MRTIPRAFLTRLAALLAALPAAFATCPEGKYESNGACVNIDCSWSPGQDSFCRECPGTTETNSDLVCELCPEGKIRDDGQCRPMNSNEACGPGEFKYQEGGACHACSSLFFQKAKIGTYSCQRCPYGTYTQDGACVSCPDDHGTDNYGKLSSDDCLTGSECPNLLWTGGHSSYAGWKCRACPAGKIKNNDGVCESCPEGQHLDEWGYQCAPCDLTTSVVDKNNECILCLGDTHPSGQVCHACPPGQTIDNGVCTCPAGTSDVDGVCVCDITGASLDDGVCTCPANTRILDGACVQDCVSTGGSLHSGACHCPSGTVNWNNMCVCSVSGALLDDGVCTCPAGTSDVDGVCVCDIPGTSLVDGVCVCDMTGASLIDDVCQCGTGEIPITPSFGTPFCKQCPGNQVLIGSDCACRSGTVNMNGVCRCSNGHKASYTGSCIHYQKGDDLSVPSNLPLCTEYGIQNSDCAYLGDPTTDDENHWYKFCPKGHIVATRTLSEGHDLTNVPGLAYLNFKRTRDIQVGDILHQHCIGKDMIMKNKTTPCTNREDIYAITASTSGNIWDVTIESVNCFDLIHNRNHFENAGLRRRARISAGNKTIPYIKNTYNPVTDTLLCANCPTGYSTNGVFAVRLFDDVIETYDSTISMEDNYRKVDTGSRNIVAREPFKCPGAMITNGYYCVHRECEWEQNQDAACQACQPGTFSDTPYGCEPLVNDPDKCPLGTYGYPPVCTECPPGKYGLVQFTNVSICYSCPLGKYQTQPGQTDCHFCPRDKPITLSPASTSITDCTSCGINEPFQYSPRVGYGSSGLHGTKCTCQNGASWNNQNSHCYGRCPAIAYYNQLTQNCEECPQGKVQSISDQKICVDKKTDLINEYKQTQCS